MDEIKSKGSSKNKADSISKDKDDVSAGTREFPAKKQVMAALTWFGCVILIFLCFLETKIWAMGVLVPVLLLIAYGAFRDSRHTLIRVSPGEIAVQDFSSFGKKEYTIDAESIVDIKVDETEEGKHKMIHHIVVNSNGKSYTLPDIDEKEELIKKIKNLKPGLQVKTI